MNLRSAANETPLNANVRPLGFLLADPPAVPRDARLLAHGFWAHANVALNGRSLVHGLLFRRESDFLALSGL